MLSDYDPSLDPSSDPEHDPEQQVAELKNFENFAVAEGDISSLVGDFYRVITAFRRVAGDRLNAVCVPVSLKNGVLRVKCASSAWAQSLTFLQTELIEKLQKELPDQKIKEIRARGGYTPLRAAPKATDLTKQMPLDTATIQRLTQLTETISDPNLRKSVLNAALASEKRRRSE